MSTVDARPQASAVSGALVEALLHPSSYSFWSDRPALVLHAVTEPVVRALLPVLVGVTVEEWDGPTSGDGFRTYPGGVAVRSAAGAGHVSGRGVQPAHGARRA